MVEPGTVLEFPTETMEVLATLEQTGDRYRVRVAAPRGGGPGIRGFGPHTHPGLVEIFECVSGTMTVRLGRHLGNIGPGERLEVPPGTIHGFKNLRDEPLVVDVDIVFTPPGPRPEADLMAIGVAIDGLMRDGEVSRWTGFPPILQLAVIEGAYPEAMKESGLAGMVMPLLAALGRLRGYRSTFPEYGH